eukprot:m51a1_g2319 hypothetical protein (207) ;mRNA; r:491466-492289
MAMAMLDALQAITTRRSVRMFDEEDVPRETLEAVLRAAASASPSAMNQQSYHFYVLDDRRSIRELSACILKVLESHGFDSARFKQSLGLNIDNVVFYDAPSIIFITLPRYPSSTHFKGHPIKAPVYLKFDAGVVTQTIIIAAHLLGLGTCPVTCTTFAEEQIKQRIGAADDESIELALAVGWPAPDARAVDFSEKQSMDDLTTWVH